MASSRTESQTMTRDEATALASGILTNHGFSESEAATIAWHLVEAELVGSPMMGLIRLRLVTDLAAKGRSQIQVIDEGPIHAHIDGANNPGYLTVSLAMEMAVRKAKEAGIATAGVVNTSLSGMMGSYLTIATEAGMVAMLSVGSYGRVAPYGGIDPILGTNPIAFGFPSDPFPIIVDVATSAASNGDVELARVLEGQLPEGAAIDSRGAPTRDPMEALEGALLPAGGHKGYGLALAMQIIGLMVGGDPVPRDLGNQGILAVAIDPSLFGSKALFDERLAELLAQVKSSKPAEGFTEVMIPGEGRARRRRETLERGIVVPSDVMAVLKAL